MEVNSWPMVSEAESKSASTEPGPTEVSVANALPPEEFCTAEPTPSIDTTVPKAAPASVMICEMSLGTISKPATSQLPPLRVPFCS